MDLIKEFREEWHEFDSTDEIEKWLTKALNKTRKDTETKMFNRLWNASVSKTNNETESAMLMFRELNKIRCELTKQKQ